MTDICTVNKCIAELFINGNVVAVDGLSKAYREKANKASRKPRDEIRRNSVSSIGSFLQQGGIHLAQGHLEPPKRKNTKMNITHPMLVIDEQVFGGSVSQEYPTVAISESSRW
uniref:Uncharacterized protein n=1 Tax=Natrinema zhouii TaxID=1710539 RepID=A0A7D6GL41_9EURY